MKTLFLTALLLAQAAVYAQPSDAYLKNRLDAEKIPGAAMAIVKDTHLVHINGIGKADIVKSKDMNRHRLFVLSSVSNTVSAMAVMQLWEKGLVQLDADINDYLPFQLVHPYHPNDTITLKRLLTHTASIEDNWGALVPLFEPGDAAISLDSFIKGYFKPGGAYYNMSGNFTTSQPGSQWQFSNMGATLAAYVVEQVTGDMYSHYCDTAIFQKLCMKNTGFFLSAIHDTGMIVRPYSWNGSFYMDNGLYGFPGYPGLMLRSTTTDMARLMRMYLNYGRYGNNRLLDSVTITYMMQQNTSSPLPPGLLYQGIGFHARKVGNGDTIVGQEGSSKGGIAAMYMNYKNKTGVLLLGNSEGTNNPLLIMDTLYRYGISKQPAANDAFPDCNESTMITREAEYEAITDVFPNPARECIQIRVPVPGRVQLVNMHGQIVWEGVLREGTNILTLTQPMPAGIYIVQFQNTQGHVYGTRRLVCLQ